MARRRRRGGRRGVGVGCARASAARLREIPCHRSSGGARPSGAVAEHEAAAAPAAKTSLLFQGRRGERVALSQRVAGVCVNYICRLFRGFGPVHYLQHSPSSTFYVDLLSANRSTPLSREKAARAALRVHLDVLERATWSAAVISLTSRAGELRSLRSAPSVLFSLAFVGSRTPPRI